MSVAEENRKPDQFDEHPDRFAGFDNWKAFVDRCISNETGLISDDLPDVDYFGLYSTGNTPREAARFAIDNAMDS